MARGDNSKFGEEHGRATLTADDVRNMRIRAARGANYSELAKEFGTSRQNVSMIIAGKRWGKVF